MIHVLLATLAIAAVSTLGDFMWATLHMRHRMVFGLAHGAILFLCIGLCLGAASKRPAAGAIGGLIAGFAGAASYYVLAPFMRYRAMFVAWVLVWLALAMLTGRLLRKDEALSWTQVLVRGFAAAIGSGIAFYLISGIWRPFNPQGWDYAVHFLAWCLAFFPGFGALLPASRPRA